MFETSNQRARCRTWPRRYKNRGRASAGALLTALALAAPPLGAADNDASGEPDIMEPFLKATGFKENHVYVAGPPDETVDPHTGNVTIVHTDLELPQKGQLSLKIVRRYDSKLYGENGRLVAALDRSALGLGWNLHMGRLRRPSKGSPIFEKPDGTRIFFHDDVAPGTRYRSQEHWEMGPCTTSWQQLCVWTDTGMRYEFDSAVVYPHGGVLGFPSIYPVTRIVDPRGHAITVSYRHGTRNALGVIDTIVDSYDRRITFGFDEAHQRYTHVDAKGARYRFQYARVGGYSLLTAAWPPEGKPWTYEYVGRDTGRASLAAGSRIDNLYTTDTDQEGHWGNFSINDAAYPSAFGVVHLGGWQGPFDPEVGHVPNFFAAGPGNAGHAGSSGAGGAGGGSDDGSSGAGGGGGGVDDGVGGAPPPGEGSDPPDNDYGFTPPPGKNVYFHGSYDGQSAFSPDPVVALDLECTVRVASPAREIILREIRPVYWPSSGTLSHFQASCLSRHGDRTTWHDVLSAKAYFCDADKVLHGPSRRCVSCPQGQVIHPKKLQCVDPNEVQIPPPPENPEDPEDPEEPDNPDNSDEGPSGEELPPGTGCGGYCAGDGAPGTENRGDPVSAVPAAVHGNLLGLHRIGYPTGGTITYSYAMHAFHSSACYKQRFPVVTQRVIAGRSVTAGTWTYHYETGLASGDRTTVRRPDGQVDVYTFFGVGSISSGTVWKMGLPMAVSRADGLEVTRYSYEAGPEISREPLDSPGYGPACGRYQDPSVRTSRTTKVEVTRDGKTMTTTYSEFDAYGQPRRIVEQGDLRRSRYQKYYYNVPRRILRGRLAEERVSTDGGSYVNSWRYTDFGERREQSLAGVVTQYDYNTAGHVSRITDGQGSWIALEDYAFGVPKTVRYDHVYVVAREVDWFGRILEVTDGRGHKTTHRYDRLGRLLETVPPEGHRTRMVYANDGRYSAVLRGGYWKVSYAEGFGRQTRTKDSVGTQTVSGYDALGRAVYRSYPFALPRQSELFPGEFSNVGDTISYDGLGRPLTTTHADGTQVHNTYTAAYVQRVDERRRQTRRYYHVFGSPNDQLLARVTDAHSQTTRYSYGPWNNLLRVDAPGRPAHRRYVYNARGQLLEEHVPERGSVTYERSSIGLMLSRTDARGTIQYDYDRLHRLERVDYPGTPHDTTIEYDRANNVVRRASPIGGDTQTTFDALNRPKKVTSVLWGKHYETSYHYDGAGCIDQLAYPTGRTLNRRCDPAGRITAINGYVDEIQYHANGQPRSYRYANGLQTLIQRDDRRRVATVRVPGVIDLAYSYDPTSNVTRIQDRQTSTTRTMSYDGLNRLRHARGPWGRALYTYDALGNRTRKAIFGPRGTQSTSYRHNAVGQLVHAVGAEAANYTYDETGNRLSGAELTYTWDATGRLETTSDGSRYFYDPAGRRVGLQKADQLRVYHYDLAGNRIAETTRDGVPLRDYLYLGNRAVVMQGYQDNGERPQ